MGSSELAGSTEDSDRLMLPHPEVRILRATPSFHAMKGENRVYAVFRRSRDGRLEGYAPYAWRDDVVKPIRGRTNFVDYSGPEAVWQKRVPGWKFAEEIAAKYEDAFVVRLGSDKCPVKIIRKGCRWWWFEDKNPSRKKEE